MSASGPVEQVAEVLEKANYRRLAIPLSIGSLTFEVAAAYVGAGVSSDLILVVDTVYQPDSKILRSVEGIARALDVMKSKRPITCVVVGPRPSPSVQESMSRVCRVLPVGVSTAASSETIKNWLAVLLPLTIPKANHNAVSPEQQLAAQISDMSDWMKPIVGAAHSGAAEVQLALHKILNSVLAETGGQNDAT